MGSPKKRAGRDPKFLPSQHNSNNIRPSLGTKEDPSARIILSMMSRSDALALVAKMPEASIDNVIVNCILGWYCHLPISKKKFAEAVISFSTALHVALFGSPASQMCCFLHQTQLSRQVVDGTEAATYVLKYVAKHKERTNNPHTIFLDLHRPLLLDCKETQAGRKFNGSGMNSL